MTYSELLHSVDFDEIAPLAEIAACCLWHSSFYGFTPRQREELFRNLESGEREPATR